MSKRKKPDWELWGAVPVLRVREAVALALDRDPDSIKWSYDSNDAEFSKVEFHEDKSFQRLMDVVRREFDDPKAEIEVVRHAFDMAESLVRSASFRSYLDRRGRTYPAAWTDTARASRRWPWGDYDTKLLRHLAAAVLEFCVSSDPDNPNPAPKNSVVAFWLIERGVSEHIAKAIATIIHADDQPAGRRRKR